jgi:hypothetical protein
MKQWKNLKARRTDNEGESYEDLRMESKALEGKVSYFIFMPVISAILIVLAWLFTMQYNTKGDAVTKEDLIAIRSDMKTDMTAMEGRIQAQLTEIHQALDKGNDKK